MSRAAYVYGMLQRDVELIAENLPSDFQNQMAIAAELEQQGQRFESGMWHIELQWREKGWMTPQTKAAIKKWQKENHR